MLRLEWNEEERDFDLVLDKEHLGVDEGLYTRAVVALFTDQRAHRDDVLPDGTHDLRGYWGDLGDTSSPLGSRLWLLSSAKDTKTTLRWVHTYAKNALQSLRSEGLASSVHVQAERIRPGVLGIFVTLHAPHQKPSWFAWELG